MNVSDDPAAAGHHCRPDVSKIAAIASNAVHRNAFRRIARGDGAVFGGPGSGSKTRFYQRYLENVTVFF